MRSPTEFRKGKPGFYPDQADLCRICLRRNSGSNFATSTPGRVDLSVAFARQAASFRRRPIAPVSAEQRHRLDAGVRQTFYEPRILREAGVPALGGEYFFLHESAIAAISRRDMSAATRLPISGHWADRAFVKPLTVIRAAIFAQAVHGATRRSFTSRTR